MADKQPALTPTLRSKLLYFLKKDIAPTRGMLYNNLQAWKREAWKLANEGREDFMNVAGEVWDAMKLTDGDKNFLNTEMLWFLSADVPDETLLKYAQATYEDLSKQSELTQPQMALKVELKKALGLMDTSWGEPKQEADIPF